MTTTGGDRLKASIRAARQQPAEHLIEVGFKDRRIAPLADILEFGRARNLPERPAFRAGVRQLEAVIKEHTGRWRTPGPTRAQAEALAIACRDTIRQAYRRFEGAPLSERQKTRKEGTEGAGRLLVGHEGEKLIGHIKAYVDGQEVGR